MQQHTKDTHHQVFTTWYFFHTYTPVTWDDAESEWSVTDVEPSACMVRHIHHQVQHQFVPC